MFFDKKNRTSNNNIINNCKNELIKLNIISNPKFIKYAKIHSTTYGFPTLSNNNKKIINKTIEKIKEKQIKNLLITGIQSSWGLIFQPDVLLDCWNKIASKY